MTNKDFERNYLCSQGIHPRSESDRTENIKLFIIEKKHFDYSFKNVLKSLDLTYDETLEQKVHLFSRFRIRIPVYSDYDCTGQLCGYSQSIELLQDDYEWKVIVTTKLDYDL